MKSRQELSREWVPLVGGREQKECPHVARARHCIFYLLASGKERLLKLERKGNGFAKERLRNKQNAVEPLKTRGTVAQKSRKYF